MSILSSEATTFCRNVKNCLTKIIQLSISFIQSLIASAFPPVFSQQPGVPKVLWSLTSRVLWDVLAGDILNTLANVSGRKHPSTVQAKQLKMCLPLMPIVLHLVTSQVASYLEKIDKNVAPFFVNWSRETSAQIKHLHFFLIHGFRD